MAHEHFIDKRGDEYITPHLQRHEIACNCGCGYGCNVKDFLKETAEIFELFRKAVSIELGKDTPIHVNRGCSCVKHHEHIYKILGLPPTKDSCHIPTEDREYACAMDLDRPDGISISRCNEIMEDIVGNKGGVGKKYKTFIHFDARGHKARW